MKAREVIQRIQQLGGRKLREGKGSHTAYVCACGRWQTTVQWHGPKDIKRGTLRAMERQLENCPKFGKGWLTK